MALKGNLREFSITQLLNLINLAKKTGTLVVDGPSEVARIIFREGKLAFATMGRSDNSLADILFRSKKISVGQLRIIKERASRMSDKELGLLLINAGYLTQEDILTSLQQYMVDIVRHLYNWADGLFRFENELLIPEDKIAVRVDLENLIIEGARQMREREQLQEEIPSLDMALKFTDRPGTNLRNINLSVEEWRVVSYINPKNSIRQIARATKMNDLEIRRVVYSLLQAGLIEVVRPEGASVAVIGRPVFQTGNKEEQKSLVNRLISRIRSL
jgi:DNA-binding MarR family transcriptional regulator